MIAAVLGTLLAPGAPSPTVPSHDLAITTAPLHVVWQAGHHRDGGSDDLNIDPETPLVSRGARLHYAHRFTRRFELAASVEYMRTSRIRDDAIHNLRATVTPSLVLGRGIYDFGLGLRVGIGAFGYLGGWAPQATAALALRNRLWVHPRVALVVGLSAGVHPGLANGSGGLERTTSYEMVSARVGLAVRLGPRPYRAQSTPSGRGNASKGGAATRSPPP